MFFARRRDRRAAVVEGALDGDPGLAGLRAIGKRRNRLPAFFFVNTAHDREARLPQAFDAAAGDMRVGIAGADRKMLYARPYDRLAAGRRAALMVAGLKRDAKRMNFRQHTLRGAQLNKRRLGMQFPGAAMGGRGQDLAFGIKG